jgi:hypothetical protein
MCLFSCVLHETENSYIIVSYDRQESYFRNEILHEELSLEKRDFWTTYYTKEVMLADPEESRTAVNKDTLTATRSLLFIC